MKAEPEGFREFVVARSPALLRTAWMLTGDPALAEDLLQTALARTWPHWERVRDGPPEAYVRTVMVRTNASWRSRLGRGEMPTSDPAATVTSSGDGAYAAAGVQGPVEDKVLLASALADLSVRQRQAVVLRFFDDLSVESVAEVMGCSTGTVKSQTAKGLAKLRATLHQDQPVAKGQR